MEVEPRYHTPRNPDRPTLGHGPAAIARAKGREPMPWQRRAYDVLLEVDPATGLPWYDLGIISTPRQSGKTTIEGDLADHRCLIKRRGRVWFTMQRGKDAAAWMRDEHFAQLAAASDVFGVQGTASCRYNLSRRAGAEGVEWPATGSTFRAFPPTRDGLHSKQSDLVIVDEAWAFDAERGAELRQAIRPTMITRPGAQLLIVSTRGDASSAFLDEYLALGRASLEDPESRVAFIDYGIPDDGDPEDLEAIAAHHPAYGHTVTMEALEAAQLDFVNKVTGVFDVAGWARAYGNKGTPTREALWPASLWTDLGLALRPEIPARAGLAFDVTPSGDRISLVASWRDDEGTAYLEVLDAGHRPQRDTPAAYLAAAQARAVPLDFDPKSPAALEVAEAIAALDPRQEIRAVSGSDYASACTRLIRAVLRRELRHFHDPDLTAAGEAATTRPMLDGGTGFARKTSEGSICEIVAGALALRAFDTLPPAPRKPRAKAGRSRH